MNKLKLASPKFLALIIVLVVVVWMLTGNNNAPTNANQISAREGTSTTEQAMQVRVRQLRASEIIHEVVVSGRTEPNRAIELRAETEGVVIALGAGRGADVVSGEVIAELDLRDRQARLQEAEALVQQRELEHAALEGLKGQQFTTEVQIAEAFARLLSARASQEKIMIELQQISIKAPFDGTLQDRFVELGNYIRSGDTVAELVDMDPMLIVGEVNEQDINDLYIGGEGVVELVSGESFTGLIRYIAPVAEKNTRTFKIELAIANPSGSVRAGLTAEMRLFGGNISIHSISPSLLTLADDGTVGVKTVDSSNRVQFFPVEIVASSGQGISITGLPDQVTLITVGQGFVTEGQLVDPVLESILKDEVENERTY